MTGDAPVIAAIDVGTNSVHMVIARGSGSDFDVITREKSSVRLGEGGDMSSLGSEAVERGLRALTRMKQLADQHGARIFAVATSAVREAANGADFVARVKRQTGIDIMVISGVEEARLIHLGATRALPLDGKRSLLIDIGGGSTEVIVADHLEELLAASFKIGAVRLTDRFFRDGAASESIVPACAAYVESMLTSVKQKVRELGHDVAVVSSGTAETLARMCVIARNGRSPGEMNALVFDRDELESVTRLIIDAKDLADRAGLPGMDPARADIILAGAIILGVMADAFRIPRFTFSAFALREGVLVDALQRTSSSFDRHSHRVTATRAVHD